MKRIKKYISILFMVVLVVILSGCSSKNEKIVGNWNYYDGKTTRDDIGYVFEKNNNGKYIFMEDVTEFTYEIDDKYISIKTNNSSKMTKLQYSIDNEMLTIKDINLGEEKQYKKQ